MIDKDVYIRNHVMGILVDYSGKGLSYSNMSELATAITEAVIEADTAWNDACVCEQVLEMTGNIEYDCPQ